MRWAFDGRSAQAYPEGSARLLFGFEGVSPHEPVAVEPRRCESPPWIMPSPSKGGSDRWLGGRVLGVAQVDAVEVLRQVADDLQIVGPPFGPLGAPGTGAVRVVIVVGRVLSARPTASTSMSSPTRFRQRRREVTVVVVLPPIFKVAKVRAPST